MSITMKDVAKAANVSTATVSKVINGSPTISEKTIENVNRIMKELNYYPNLRAQNFARQSTHTIVFATKLERNSAFSNPHMFEIMSGVVRTLSNKKYNMNIIDINEENELDSIEQIIAQKSADGLVIHVSVLSKEMESIIRKNEFPHIVIGCPNYESHLCWIDNNNYLSGEIATNHLIEKGYKNIGFIGGFDEDRISTHRLQGAITALTEKHLKMKEEHIGKGNSSREESFDLMEKMLKQNGRPDAIICANNHIALGVVKAIKKHKLRIPRDIGVITFDDYPFSRITDPMLTVVNIDVFDLGQQAGKLIINKIKKPNLQIQSYTTLPNLIVRESTNK